MGRNIDERILSCRKDKRLLEIAPTHFDVSKLVGMYVRKPILVQIPLRAFTSYTPLFTTNIQLFVLPGFTVKGLVSCMEVFISGAKRFKGNNKNATKKLQIATMKGIFILLSNFEKCDYF